MAVVALFSAALFALPFFNRLEGLSIDVLGWLRHKTFGAQYTPTVSPAVVIAIDEMTYRTPPFQNLPKVMWTKQFAKVLNAAVEGGAAIVGFDLILPTSVERHLRGYDREFLVALRKASRLGKVVLGKVQHQTKPISPFAGYSFAVGHQKNIRLLNLIEDPDGIIRRIPLEFSSKDLRSGSRTELSFALELASRKLQKKPVKDSSGRMRLDGHEIPGARNNALTVNFNGGGAGVPSYSFADLHACAEQDNKAYFRKHFAGKVVLIGAVLDVEDRKLTSARLFPGTYEKTQAERCAIPLKSGAGGEIARDSIPGVYVHANAVNNLLRKEALLEFSPLDYALLSLPLALLASALALSLAPMHAALGFFGLAAIWTIGGIFLFQNNWALPLFGPLASGGLSFAANLAYRVVFLEHDKRFIRQAFSTYLSPQVVEEVVENPELLKLGGERKEITAFFSDVAGFTAISESMSPEALVGLLNEYLSEMTDIILEHGGTVDKYEGDAIVAFFGAPRAAENHALDACAVSLQMQKRLAQMRTEWKKAGKAALFVRIGLNSGPAIVGNMGSSTRFDYTMMGDTVNTAARLEGVNKQYGTSIMIGAQTYAQAKGRVAARELDLINVVGKTEPVPIYELLAESGGLDGTKARVLALYEQALAEYRSRNFGEAEKLFGDALAVDKDDGPARTMAARCRFFLANPPPDGWSGSFEMTEK